MISLLIPYHDSPKTAIFLARLLASIDAQTYKDYELVLMKKGRMGETYNACIKAAKGDLLKIMGMDDYFYDETALQRIVAEFERNPKMYWLTTACLHDDGTIAGHLHVPRWNDRIHEGYNTVGGFAVNTIRNKDVPEIDESLDWMVDVDWYIKLNQKHGQPYSIDDPLVVIGIGDHQTTNKLSDEQKKKEWKLIAEKYGN